MMLSEQHHQPRTYPTTTRHHLAAGVYRALARAAGTIDRWTRRPATLAVGALAAVSGLLVVGAEHSASHPVPVAAAPHLGPGSMPAEVAFAYVDGLPGLTATGSPTVLDNDWSTATVAVPVSPHRSAIVVVDDLVRAPGHLFGRWVVVDHWLPPASS